MKITAVSFKINSVQDYIYNSNKLKENIGASLITSHEIFHVCMKNTLQSIFTTAQLVFDYHSGNNGAAKKVEIITTGSHIQCEVAEMGGGGALILFKHTPDATRFIREFSKNILLQFPGLKTSFAYLEDEFSNYRESVKKLNGLLNQNKNGYAVNTTVPKHGITADCPFSNESAQFWYQEFGTGQFISGVSQSKLGLAQKSAQKDKELLASGQGYVLTTDLEQLGQNDKASYIAVVHIDGNGIGKRFAGVNSFEELRAASLLIKDATTGATRKLIDTLIANFTPETTDVNPNWTNQSAGNKTEVKRIKEIKLKDNGNGEKILPIRPILAGGDDVTFVCEGRLGIYLAEEFIKSFVGERDVVEGACAGVAIVKTHFPFYKAYELAEELCREAKELCRTSDNKPEAQKSYLSFYYSATTFSGSLNQLRARTHRLADGRSMYYGPYNIFDEGGADAIKKLKEGIKHFRSEKKFPKNKTMKLREVIADSVSARLLFLKEMNEAGNQLPGGGDKIWYAKPGDAKQDSQQNAGKKEFSTPYFDQIELMDFYPAELL